MVGGVARGVLDAEAVHLLAPGERTDAVLGHRHDLAPEPLHRVAVEPRRRCSAASTGRRGGGRPLVHVDLEIRPALDQRAGAAGVVEVDVGQQKRRAAARRPAPRAASCSDDSGPGSIEHVARRAQQPITCLRPRWLDVDQAHGERRLGHNATGAPCGRPSVLQLVRRGPASFDLTSEIIPFDDMRGPARRGRR